jgi:aromatic-L-amino-acid decarboxylase
VVSTIGTTSSTGIDPVASVADIAQREGLWHHVDAAYAGVVALIPERRLPFGGWERADSMVVNPHKWLFTPLDCSLLLSRRLDVARDAFSLVPEYLRTRDASATEDGRHAGRDYHEYQPQLGRRFRALKMWMILRYFGLQGLRSRIEGHLALADELTHWIDAEPDAQRLAPRPFATVCFRWRPARFIGREDEPEVKEALDRLNERLLAGLNDTGEVFLSHTRLRDRFTLRISIGNLRTGRRHVARAWELVCRLGRELDAGTPGGG